MGDRANVRLDYYWQYENQPPMSKDKKKDGRLKDSIFLYTHWDGTRLPILVHEALARRERWTDTAYLTRIVFSTMVRGHEKESTSYGISTWICDNEHAIIVLNTDKQTIGLELQEGDTQFEHVPYDTFVETPLPLLAAYYEDLDLSRDAQREIVRRANERRESKVEKKT